MIFSCNKSNDEVPTPPMEARNVEVTLLQENVTPMSGGRKATDGVILKGYTLILKDEQREFVVDNVDIPNFQHTFEEVYGTFTVSVIHPNSCIETVIYNYYLSGEEKGTSADKKVKLTVANHDYAYITARSVQDEVTGGNINGVEMKVMSESEKNSFFAYVVAGKQCKLTVNTTRGDIPKMIKPTANLQYTYFVDFDTKVLINYALGFDTEVEPEKIHPPVVPLTQVYGYDDISIGEVGELRGQSSQAVYVWQVDKGGERLDAYSFDINVATSSGNSFMNIYVENQEGDYERLTYFTEGVNKGKWSVAGEVLDHETMMSEYGSHTVRNDYFEFPLGIVNFVWRSGDSNAKGGTFEINTFDID